MQSAVKKSRAGGITRSTNRIVGDVGGGNYDSDNGDENKSGDDPTNSYGRKRFNRRLS